MIDTTTERVDLQQTYEESAADSTYEIDDGLIVIPVQGPAGTPPVVARLHAAYSLRKSRFSYSKRRVPPLIPSPGNTRSGAVFLSGHLNMNAPGTSSEGELVYNVSGQYNFVCAEHVKDTGKLVWDCHPYPTRVDLLGNFPQELAQKSGADEGYLYNTYMGLYFDLDKFSTNRILG